MKKIVTMLTTVLLGTCISTTVLAGTNPNVWSETTVESDSTLSTTIKTDGTVTDGVLEITFDDSVLSCDKEDVLVSNSVDMYSVNVEDDSVKISFLSEEKIKKGTIFCVSFDVADGKKVDPKEVIGFSGEANNAKGESVTVKATESATPDTEEPVNTEKPEDSSNQGSDNHTENSGSSNNNQSTNVTGTVITVDTTAKWDEVVNALSQKPAGSSVTVQLNSSKTLPKTAINAIKGKDINLVVKLDNGVTWKINGMSVSGNVEDVDLNVALHTDVIPQKAVDKVADGKTYIELSLSHDGAFHFDATLSLNVGSENSGKYAKLYYYNPASGKLEFQTYARIDANGNAELLFKHASDYIIVIDDKAPAAATDDTNNFAFAVTMLAFGCVLAVAGFKKKKSSMLRQHRK